MNPIKTFVNRPVFTAMLVLSLVVFGLYGYPRIGIDQLPNMDVPVVTVTTILPGADPETVERTVTDPLEEVLNSLAGLDMLQSFSLDNVSRIVIKFRADRNVDIAAQDVRDKIQASLGSLPSDAKSPVIEKLDINSAPVVTLALTGPLPIEELTKLTEEVVKPSLQQIAGVGSVEIVGGRKREIGIVVDPTRLRAFGLAASEVAQAVRAQHLDIPAGRTAEPSLERTVKLAAEATGVEALRDLVVGSPRGTPVRLRDVAEVEDGPAECRSTANWKGQPALGLSVRKQSGANTVEVSASVQSQLGRISSGLPKNVSLETVYDGSRFIRKSISSVEEDLLLGGVFAVAVVLLFLRNWRSTIVSAVALPVSVVGTFAVMALLDFTFNTITMIALTLSIGLLIDDAIVVIENIVRHLEAGKPPWTAAVEATREIGLAVLAVTLAIVAVFVPVAFMRGIVGRLFFQFGVTVVAAVTISYVVSMTLTPMLSARLLREGTQPGVVSRTIERALRAIETSYRWILALVLRQRAATALATLGVLVATVLLARGLKFTMMPKTDESRLKVSVEMPAGSRVEDTERQLLSLGRQVEKIPGVKDTFVVAGGGTEQEASKGDLLVGLVGLSARTYSQQRLQEYLRETLAAEPGVIVTVSDMTSLMGGVSYRMQEVQFNLRGPDWEAVRSAAAKVEQFLRSRPQFTDIDTSYRTGKPQLEVVVDRDRASALGIPAAPVGIALRALLGGDKIADYREKGETYEIKLRLPAGVLAEPEALGSLQVRAPTGQLVEVRNLAAIREGNGSVRIERQSQVRQITVLAGLRDFSLSEAQSLLRSYAARELPSSVHTDFGGAGSELETTLRDFALALVLGIVLVYMILAAQFESLVLPLSIMMALPLAVIGAIAALLLTRQYVSVFGMIGILMLMGLVTKNGILLIEFTNQLRHKGLSTREALLEAGPVRLRPILMTTVAMVAGMLPVALARGEGAELRVSMGVTVIGGLITSTFLTLGVVPVVYSLLDSLSRRLWTRAQVPQPAEGGLGATALN